MMSGGMRKPMLARAGETVRSVLHTVLGLALLVVVAVNVFNATSRYLFGFSPVGTDELMIYMVIWIVMVAAVLSFFLREHISVNLLPLYLRGRARRLLFVIHDAAAVFACGYATHASWMFIEKVNRLGLKSMGLGLPMTVPHSAMLAGFAGLTLAGAVMFLRDGVALLRGAAEDKA